MVIDGDRNASSPSFASTFISSYDVDVELGPCASNGFPPLLHLDPTHFFFFFSVVSFYFYHLFII